MKTNQYLVLGIYLALSGAVHAQSYEPATRSICEYGRGEALAEASIKRGTVVHVSTVDIAAAPSTLTLGGVVAGAAAVAATKDQDAGTRAAVAVLGAAAGYKVAERVGKSEALRFLVEDKQGTIIALVAESDDCARAIAKGDTVFVSRGTRTRLIRE